MGGWKGPCSALSRLYICSYNPHTSIEGYALREEDTGSRRSIAGLRLTHCWSPSASCLFLAGLGSAEACRVPRGVHEAH